MPSWTLAGAIAQRRRLERPRVVVEQAAARAKLLLLGDLQALRKALPEGVGLPTHPNTVAQTPGLGECLWLRPKQRLLLLSSAAGAPQAAAAIRAMSAADAWALDAGARYAEFSVAGKGAIATLNAGCGLDLRERAFAVDTCAQSRIDLCPVLLLRSSQEQFEVFVDRPLAGHLWLWLCRAADNI